MKRGLDALHAEADRLEPRLAAAVVGATEKMRDHVSINLLAMALGTRNARAALAMLPASFVGEAMEPCAAVVRAAVIRGGKVAAGQINEALR